MSNSNLGDRIGPSLAKFILQMKTDLNEECPGLEVNASDIILILAIKQLVQFEAEQRLTGQTRTLGEVFIIEYVANCPTLLQGQALRDAILPKHLHNMIEFIEAARKREEDADTDDVGGGNVH